MSGPNLRLRRNRQPMTPQFYGVRKSALRATRIIRTPGLDLTAVLPSSVTGLPSTLARSRIEKLWGKLWGVWAKLWGVPTVSRGKAL